MRNLWSSLLSEGHSLIWLAQHEARLGDLTLKKGDPEDCDVVFFYWRWKMHESYKERNQFYTDQFILYDMCDQASIPYIIWDGDHKLTDEQIESFNKKSHAYLASPELDPRDGFHSVMYPNPHTLINPRENRMPFFGDCDLIYIGNNYERWDQWLEYVAKPSKLGLNVRCYGNWLEPHPDRTDPREIVKLAPKVEFPGRIPQHIVVQKYFEADTTVHLAKPSYCETGFVTMRWAETAAAGTYGYIPKEFKNVPESLQQCVVKNGKGLVEKHRGMDENDWLRGIDAAQAWVDENMRAEKWIEMFEEAANA